MKKLFALLTLSAACTAAHANLTDGLRAAYLMEGDARDVGALEQHGQLMGGTFTTDRFGQPNRALQLDGQGAWMSTPVDGQRHPLSLSFWFYLEGRPGERHFAVLSSSMADAFGHGFVIGSGTNQLNANLVANFTFASHRWTHGVVTYGDTIRVYLDGKLSAEKPTPPGAGVPAGNFAIGTHRGSPDGAYFPGALDDVLIYDRVLGPEEVAGLYDAGFAVADTLKAAQAERARMASLAAAATARDGTRAERPLGLAATGSLPLAITVSSVAEPGTNVWNMMDADTNTAWTAAADTTGWWLAAEYEESVTVSNVWLSAQGDTATGARWLASPNGTDWAAWTPGEPVTLRWLVGLIPSEGEDDQPPAVTELRVQ